MPRKKSKKSSSSSSSSSRSNSEKKKFYVNQSYPPLGSGPIIALTPNQTGTLNVEAKVHHHGQAVINFTANITPANQGSVPVRTNLQINLLRDGQSITGGFQNLFRSLETSIATRILTFQFADIHVHKGHHRYTIQIFNIDNVFTSDINFYSFVVES